MPLLRGAEAAPRSRERAHAAVLDEEAFRMLAESIREEMMAAMLTSLHAAAQVSAEVCVRQLSEFRLAVQDLVRDPPPARAPAAHPRWRRDPRPESPRPQAQGPALAAADPQASGPTRAPQPQPRPRAVDPELQSAREICEALAGTCEAEAEAAAPATLPPASRSPTEADPEVSPPLGPEGETQKAPQRPPAGYPELDPGIVVRDFEVTIGKLMGEQLGIVVDRMGTFLRVKTLGAGLIQDWNESVAASGASGQLLPGDDILEVNGVRNNDLLMQEELEERCSIRMVAWRQEQVVRVLPTGGFECLGLEVAEVEGPFHALRITAVADDGLFATFVNKRLKPGLQVKTGDLISEVSGVCGPGRRLRERLREAADGSGELVLRIGLRPGEGAQGGQRQYRLGDMVASKGKSVKALCLDSREWLLKQGQAAQVVEVDEDGDVRLRNPRGDESGWQFAIGYEEVKAELALDGTWVHQAEDGGDPPKDEVAELVQKGKIFHKASGIWIPLRKKSDGKVSLRLGEQAFKASHSGDTLIWEDGDIWQRVSREVRAIPPAETAAAPSEVGQRQAALGERVWSSTFASMSASDAKGNAGAWTLDAGETATVVEVSAFGKVRLRGADGLESGWLSSQDLSW